VYYRAARSIRQAQFVHFESMRLSSQPDGAMQTSEFLVAAAPLKGFSEFTQDVKVKEGDGEEILKSASICGESLTVESKSGGLFSKRTSLAVVGLPVSFVDAFTISLPSRVSEVRLIFSDSRRRDMYAYKLFLHAKGDPDAFMPLAGSVPAPQQHQAESIEQRSIEDEDPLQPFVAVLEKQGPCEFQIRPAVDGTPHLYASPTAESRALVCRHCVQWFTLSLDLRFQGFPEGLNMHHLCVRSSKNVRDGFKVRASAYICGVFLVFVVFVVFVVMCDCSPNPFASSDYCFIC
jgi:hypothetical protein